MFSKLKVFAAFSLILVGTTVAFNNCSGEFSVQSGLKNSLSMASQGGDIPVDLRFDSASGDVFTNADPSVSFTVTSDSKDYVLKCYINSVEIATCASPINLSAQQDGDQSVRIVAQTSNGRAIKEISRIFKIDRAAPILTIASRPAAQISSLTTSILFTATDNVSVASDISVQCAIDTSAYATCTSPKVFSALSLGTHTIKLKATDKAGNVSPETTISFSVVVGLPVVNITAAPNPYTNSTAASFTFSATSTDSTIAGYECSIDNGVTYTVCTSPKTYTALENRIYNFAVRAKDAVSQVSGAATRQFTVDTVAPSTPTVSSNLASPSNQASLSLTFASTDSSGIASYQCAQDGGAFATCTSPKIFAVASGTRIFKVKSTDAAGNVSQEGTYSIVIDTAAPTLDIMSGPANPTTETSASFAFTAADTPAGIKTVECRLDTETNFSNCTSSKSYTNVALGNRSFSVRASDNAGNTITKSYAWTVNAIVREPAATPTPPPVSRIPTHVACVGDSITYGYQASPGKAYPNELQRLFGSSVKVGNFGVSGATMQNSADMPYTRQLAYTSATTFVANAGANAVVDVVIMLGTNDSKPQNWTASSSTQFTNDYVAMINYFANLSTRPKIYVALPANAYCGLNITPCSNAAYGINGTIIAQQIVPLIKKLAAAQNVSIIDINSLMNNPSYFADGVHPSDEGYTILGQDIYSGLTAAP